MPRASCPSCGVKPYGVRRGHARVDTSGGEERDGRSYIIFGLDKDGQRGTAWDKRKSCAAPRAGRNRWTIYKVAQEMELKFQLVPRKRIERAQALAEVEQERATARRTRSHPGGDRRPPSTNVAEEENPATARATTSPPLPRPATRRTRRPRSAQGDRQLKPHASRTPSAAWYFRVSNAPPRPAHQTRLAHFRRPPKRASLV